MVRKQKQESESTSRQLGRLPFDAKQGRDEMNLVEFPLTLLTEKTTPGQTALHWADDIVEGGRAVRREVVVTGSPQWGLPTAKDEDVLVGMIQLTKARNEFTDATVPFTRLELIDLLEWPNHHWSYGRLAQSFERWRAVSISYKQAWRDNANRQWTTRTGFGLIDSFELTDARRAGTAELLGEGRSWWRWNGYLFDSFRAGFLKKLDYGVYKSLNSQITKRLYRYLDKQFYGPGRQKLDFDLRVLACQHLGLSANYDAAQIRRKLQPAVEELEAIGFLAVQAAADRYRKVGWGKWKVSFARKSFAGDAVERAPQPEVSRPVAPREDILHKLRQLPAEDQARFERDAVAAAADFLRDNYRDSRATGGPLFEATRRKLLADHFARLGR